MTTQATINSMSRSPLRLSLLLALGCICFALLPAGLAQLPSPTPDGGYPNNNTAEGSGALFNVTSGVNNTALGYRALFKNTVGNDNTATGYLALRANRSGGANVANGDFALLNNTSGGNNTAIGFSALAFNTTGNSNTATGFDALFSSTGDDNTADGAAALASNTTGSANTAIGVTALRSNTTGNSNTGSGLGALSSNTTASFNTATGQGSLFSNTTGQNNMADGQNALRSNTTGGNNIALGSNAGFNLTTGSNNIDIGNRGVAGDANAIRIGKQGTQTATFIAGISGTTVTGTAVVVNGSGQLGVAPSSQRFKQDIQTMGDASDALLALHPVTFHYKPELDPKGIPQFGLVAEQVEKVDPNLVTRDDQGKVYTVRYEAVNAMLLNEFLKEHRKVEEQNCKVEYQGRKEQEDKATIRQLKSTVAQQRKDFQAAIAQQQREIKALTAGVQKMSDQLELTKRAPQLAAINE